MAEDWGTNDLVVDDEEGFETWGENDPVIESEQDQQDWGINDPVIEDGEVPTVETAKPAADIVQQYGEVSQRYSQKGKTLAQSAQRFEQLANQPERTPEEETELASSWRATLQVQADISKDAAELKRLQPEYDKYFADQKQARIDYIEDRRGSGIFGDEAAEALYDIDARAEQEYAQARTIEDTDKRKEAMAAIQAKYQTEEKNLTNQFVERFKENETKINNASEAIGKAIASGQSVDQFFLETNASAPEYDELRQSLINQDDPESGKLFREARAMVDLAEGTNKVGIVNGEIRVSPLHVWDAEGIKSEINALDISEAKKRKTIATIPQLQQEAVKVEFPFLQQISEFRNFVKDNNLENVSPQRQISEWKNRNENWVDYISKAPAQVGIGLKTGTLGLLEAGQAIVGATALTMGAQEFADPFLDSATKTSDEIQRLSRISQEIGGPTFAAELAAVVPQIVTQIGVGGAVSFGGTKLGLKPKVVSNIGFGSSVGTALAQSYGGVLSSAFQQLEKEKIDAGMDPIQARAEAVKEAQLPAALSGLSTAIVTTLGGKRGAEAVFRQGADGIRAKLNTAAFRAELPKLIPDVVKGMRNEGYEEFADQIAQGIIEQFSFNPQLSTSDIINNAFKALAIGGITGGTVEGLKYGFDYMKAPKEMARREASMASIRQSIADAEQEISNISASSPIGSEFQREYDATLPSDEAASLGGVAVDRTRMNALQAERQQLSELLEDDTISRVARNQLEGKLAAADLAYYNEVLVPMRRNVVNEQMVDQLEVIDVSDQTKDGIRAMAKIANGLGADTLTGRERVAVGITSVGGGRFLPSRKNPMVEVDQAGQAKVTEAGRLMAENVGIVPLVRMIGLSETTRAKQAEMERVVAEAEARKAQQDAKDTAESEEAKRYGPASAEALKQQVATQPPTPEVQSNARLAQLLKEQEEAARLGEEAVARAVETRFIESFRSTISEAIIPTAERAATIDLNNFRDVINSIAQEIDKGTFKIELIEQGEFKNILPESAFTTVVEAFKENPQRALNALRAFGDEVENAVKEFGGGAAGEPEEPAEVVSIRRVLRAEQTPEDVTALTEAGLVEVYKDQPILTQAGIDALPETERPRLTPEARKIQIDTGASEVLAEAISKGLRIGIDQVPPAFKMPEGWTLDGDIYIPPVVQIIKPTFKQKVLERKESEKIDRENAPIKFTTQMGSSYSIGESGIIYRDKFDGKKFKADKIGFVSKDNANKIAKLPKQYEGNVIRVIHEQNKVRFVTNHQLSTEKTVFEAPTSSIPQKGMYPIEGSNFVPHLGDVIINVSTTTPPPVAPTVGAITEEQANNAIKAAQEERARKPAQDIGRSRWGAQSIAPKQSIGKTVREALKTASRLNLSKIAKSDPNEIMMQDVAAILAELDMPILDLEPIKSLASLRKKGRPRRWGGGQSVIGLPSTIPMPVEYLVHEAGHTITADQVRRYLPREKFARGKGYLDAINKVIADPKTPEPISRLFSLYVSTIEQLGIADQYFVAGGIAGGKSADASKALAQRAQAKGLIRKDIKPEDFYGLANVEEFVSQTFSEQSFRDLLKSLKDPTNPRQSLWQAFVDAIQRVLQLPKGTMAAAVVEASIDVGMLVEPDRVRARGRAGVTPAPAPEPEMAPEPETGKTVEMSLEMEKERTFQLLGERLYTAELPKVVVKETVQNGFDAIKDAEETGEIPRGSGVITYSRKELEVNGEKIVRMMFADNGGGMTPEILQNAFFTVGGTFKRSGKGSGGFGLAKLGMFMSADRVMVETVRDGVVTTADLTKQELVDKKFNVNVAEDPNRQNGTMVVLEFKKSITRSDGKTVEFENPYTQFDKLIHHDLTVIDDSYGTYQNELIGLFQNKTKGRWTLDEIKKINGQTPYTFEDFVRDVPNVETFEQDFVIAGAKKPIKVRVAAARLGLKRKDGKAKYSETLNIAGSDRSLKNYNMSVYSNGLFQFEKENLKIDPQKLWGGDPLPYNIIVDIDAGGLDAASLAYPFTNSREDFQNGVVKDYVNQLLNDIRVKERQRQFDQEFNLLTDISGGKPRKDSPTLYNNTTIVPQPFEQKFLEDLTKAVFDVADDLVVALRKGNEDGILEDTWYKVKSQKGSVAPTGRAEENSLDYFYGVGISKNWGGVNTSRDPVSVLVNPIYEERVDEYARTEFGRRILARTIAKTLIHEINHHLHRNEGSDFTFFILQNETYLGEVGAIQSAVDKILPIVNQHPDAIISLKNKFRTAETKDTDNELTGEQYERSSKEPDGQPRTTVVGGDRLVQQPSAEVSPRPTSEEDGEQTGAYLPSSLTVGGRQDAGIGEGISFGEALSSSLVENQAQINEEGISRAEGGVAEAITPQQDRDYLDAAERGDLETAQRMVDGAANRAGYDKTYYHGTSKESAIDIRKNGIDQMRSEKGYFGRGFYMAEDKKLAQKNYADFSEEEDGGDVVNITLPKKSNILDLRKESDFLKFKSLKYNGISAENLISRDDFHQIMKSLGVDGLIDESFGGIVLYNESIAKLSEPVTYDDQGNIIPLSQRFQPEQADIRYAPEEEFEIIPEQVEDQIEGTPEAATIKVMGQAFQMANEQSEAMGTAEGTLPLETITSAWMNSGRDVETLENAIIRYTNLEPEAAATLAQAIGKQVEIQRGIMEISDAASRRKAEKEAEPEIKPYSFAQRIKEDLPPDMRSKVSLAYEVLRNEVSVEEANRVMSGLTLDEAIKATEDMTNGVSMPVRSMMAQIVLRKIMDRRKSTKGKRGKEADYKAVVQAHVEFHDFINDYFKELGQGVQAIARFSDLGADGVLLKVRKDIDKAISKHITNRKGQIEKIKRDVEDADNAAFNAAIKSNKDNIDKTAKKAGEQEAKKMTIEEQAQKLAIRAAKKVAGEEVRRRQPDPLSDLVNGHLRRYNANFIAEATAMGVSPVTAQAIEDSAKKLRDSRQAAKAERERFKEMQEERMKVKKELARENKYIYGERPTIWEDYQQMFSERLARRLMRDPKKKVPPSLLLFTDRLTENLLGFVPEVERQATTQRSFQAMIEDALNNKEKYQEAFNQALEDISLKVMELEARVAGGEAVPSATYKRAVAAQEFLERLEPMIQQFPVSDKLILRFVNQKMKAMGESLVGRYNDWYRSSRKTRIDIEKQLAETLVADFKVNYADSIRLSQAIIKDFRAKAEERREKALARFKKPKEKTKPLAQSPLKKFFELVNIGALTDQDAYEVMAHRFELPTWDPKFAKQIEEMALILEDMPEGMERRRLTRNMMAEIARRKGFSLSDLGSGFFYSNMLSSVETFLINLQDTLIGNFVNGLASSVAEKDFSRMSGLISGYRKGWKEAVQVFRTGLRINMPRLEEKTPLTVELVNYGRKGGVPLESTDGMNAIAKTLLESPPAKVLNWWRYVTRIMEATDALNYAASSEGQRYAEAAKMAKDEGLEGKAKQKRINQILNLGDDVYQAALKQAEQEGYTGTDAKFRAMEIQDSEIDAELREKSFNRALTDVYRNMPTGLAGFTAAQFNNYVMRIANPWFRNAFKLFTAPFVITPTNLFNRWLDYSPYGYKRLFYGSGNLLDKDTPYYVAPPKIGSAEFYTQALKASSSVMVMGLAAGLIKAGLLTLRGMGPSDEEERKQWLADGNRPHTFSFMGGPQISYQFTPWALVLSWMANYQNWEQYNAKEDASGAERAIVAMTSATSVIMDLPFFAGPAEFLDAIQSKKGDPVAALGKYVEGKMGMVYPNLVRQIDRIFDPTIYDSQGIKGILIDQMPFARRLGTQRVNLFGDPIGEDKPAMDRLVGRIISSPTKPSRESRILAKYDIYPYMPSPKEAKALVDGEEAQMTEEQYNKFVQIVGKDVKKRINDLFDPEGEITEKERERGKKRISQIFERARARAVREVSTY